MCKYKPETLIRESQTISKIKLPNSAAFKLTNYHLLNIALHEFLKDSPE